jgi:hypothetical protein
MQRSFVLAAAAAATVLAAGAAHAGGRVDWSIGINVPPIAAVVSAPAYYPARAYYSPAPYPVETYYPSRVVYAPRPRFWVPPLPPLPRFGFGWHREGWRDAGWHGDGRRDEGWRR